METNEWEYGLGALVVIGLVVLSSSDPMKILMMVGGLISLLVVAWVVIAVVKSKAKAMMSDDMAQSFVLSDLRKMHAEGNMTDEEFERAKTAMFGGRGGGESGGVLGDVDSIKMKGGGRPISSAGEGAGFELGEELLPPSKKYDDGSARSKKYE